MTGGEWIAIASVFAVGVAVVAYLCNRQPQETGEDVIGALPGNVAWARVKSANGSSARFSVASQQAAPQPGQQPQGAPTVVNNITYQQPSGTMPSGPAPAPAPAPEQGIDVAVTGDEGAKVKITPTIRA